MYGENEYKEGMAADEENVLREHNTEGDEGEREKWKERKTKKEMKERKKERR